VQGAKRRRKEEEHIYIYMLEILVSVIGAL
jgi:hypothetical protein